MCVIVVIALTPWALGAGASPVDAPWFQSARLGSDPPVAGASFGSALSASGDRLLVGAPGEAAAYVFERGPDGWVQVARLSVAGLGTWSAFGTAVALYGDTAFLGSPGTSSLYVFSRDQEGGWSQTQIVSSGGAPGATRFGNALATDGSRLVVGASHTATAAGSQAGAVHVYTGVGGTLTLEQTLTAGLGAPALLGWSVAISGDTLVAGATRAQAALVFERGDDAWLLAATFTSDVPNDGFARAVAVDGNTVAVGSPFAFTGDQVETGLVEIYARGAGGWAHAVQLLPEDLSPVDRSPALGTSLALGLDGTVLLAGAPGEDASPGLSGPVPAQTDPVCVKVGASPTCRPSGAAYVFARDDSGWRATEKLVARDAPPYKPQQLGQPAAVGQAVALDGAIGQAFVGAPFTDRISNDRTGTVYRFGGEWLGVAR